MAEEINGVVVNNEVIIAPLPAGTAQIGTVGLVAGTAQIGTVALTAGNAAIGTVGVTGSVAVTGTFFQATQPVSGTVSLGAGSAAIGTVTLGAGSAAVGSVTVSGSVAVTSGTFATASAQTAVQGSATGGTAASVSQLDGGVYSSTAPTLINGQQAALQLDSSGNLKVNVVTGGTGSSAVTIAAGADATEGNTTDAPLTAAASTTASTISSALKGLFNLFFLGAAKINAATFWIENANTSVSANSVTVGANRSTGAPTTSPYAGTGQGSPSPYGYFQVECACTTAGNLTITNASTGIATTYPVAAGTPVTAKRAALGNVFYASFANGATAGTLTLASGFTAA